MDITVCCPDCGLTFVADGGSTDLGILVIDEALPRTTLDEIPPGMARLFAYAPDSDIVLLLDLEGGITALKGEGYIGGIKCISLGEEL